MSNERRGYYAVSKRKGVSKAIKYGLISLGFSKRVMGKEYIFGVNGKGMTIRIEPYDRIILVEIETTMGFPDEIGNMFNFLGSKRHPSRDSIDSIANNTDAEFIGSVTAERVAGLKGREL